MRVAGVVCFGIALVEVAAAWRVLFSMRIGPVVAVLDEQGGHGVHAGDMLAAPLLMGAAMLAIAGLALLHHAAAGSHLRHRAAAMVRPVGLRVPARQLLQ